MTVRSTCWLPAAVRAPGCSARSFPPPSAPCPRSLRSRLDVVQQAREEQVDAVRAAYAEAGVKAVVEPFFNDMQDRLAAAHLVIARAGASTVTELAIAGRPSILVPLAIAMDDHQTANAEGMVMGAAADVLVEERFTPEALASLLAERLPNAGVLRARAKAALSLGRPNAARDWRTLPNRRRATTRRDAGSACRRQPRKTFARLIKAAVHAQ